MEQDLDDDVNPFHMVTPTTEDMHPHDDFVTSPFTPANGSPTTDPGYSHQLQNPNAYGPNPKVKQLAMISSKIQWNGRRGTFDELKFLIEGHFEGYGAPHLVNRKFIEVYIEHGYKVLRFFPWIKITPMELQKQNATLYGSLKQICRKGAARAIIRKHESQQDGIKTWLDLLNRYDNMGSSDVKTLYYDEMLNHPFHHKYPGGLEQYAADYEEAYCELAVIGEHYSNETKRRKILTNLYDPGNPETKILVAYCERECKTFEEIVDHLTDTSIKDSHYNAKHATRKARTAQRLITSDESDADSDDDLRTMLKFARDMKKLPDDYKIPSKAWSLLSQEARDAFIAERNKITGNNDTKNNSSIPKQYGGAGHDDTRKTNAVTTIDPDKEDEDTDSSGDSDTEQLV